MAKQGDLCDDSALINAFDEAISKYKRMHGHGHGHGHGRGLQGNLEEAGNTTIAIEENKSSPVDDENGIGKRDYLQVDVDSTCAPPTNIPEIGKSPPLDSSESIQNLSQGNLNMETDDYTRLLNEYYQIEEQRQTILQQLQQYSNPSCQVSVSDPQYGVYPSQDGFSSCCQYSGQCFVAPCSYGGTCEYGETCLGISGMPSSYSQADDVTKTGIDAAASDTCIKHSNEKGEETIGQTKESSRTKTDLSTVLEAWFSAGFHTGKYEAEQAHIKKGQ